MPRITQYDRTQEVYSLKTTFISEVNYAELPQHLVNKLQFQEIKQLLESFKTPVYFRGILSEKLPEFTPL